MVAISAVVHGYCFGCFKCALCLTLFNGKKGSEWISTFNGKREEELTLTPPQHITTSTWRNYKIVCRKVLAVC